MAESTLQKAKKYVSRAKKGLIGTSDDEKLSDWCQDVWNQAKRGRESWERRAYLNYQFFIGNHYVEWDDTRKTLVLADKVPSYRVRLVDNRIWSIARNIAARVTDPHYAWEVLPGSQDPQDIEGAKKASKAFEYLHQKLQVGRKNERVAISQVVLGRGYVESSWDPRAENGLGEVTYNVVNPFDIYLWPPTASDWDEVKVLIKVVYRDYDELQGNSVYDQEVVKKLKPQGEPHPSFLRNKLFSQAQRTFFYTGPTEEIYKDRGKLLVYEYQIRERDEAGHKHLRVVTQVQNSTIRRDVLEFPTESFTTVPFDNNVSLFDLYPASDVEQLIPLQRELNRSRSQIVEHKNLMCKPKFLVPKQAQLGKNSLTAEPGEVVEYTYPYRPEILVPPSLPLTVENHVLSVVREMEDISGVHDISLGRIPAGAKSGKALEILQESDATIIRPKQRQFQYSLVEVGRLILGYMKRYYAEARKIRVRGEGAEEVMEFSREDIPDSADVRVNVGTDFTYTRTARLDELKELYAMKAIGRATLLKNYEFPNVAEAIEEAEAEEAKAAQLAQTAKPTPNVNVAVRADAATPEGKALLASEGLITPGQASGQVQGQSEEEAVKEADNENITMAEGGDVTVEPDQNHEIHVQVHQLFQRSREYQQVLPANRDKIEAHIQEHLNYLNQEAGIPMAKGGETYGTS